MLPSPSLFPLSPPPPHCFLCTFTHLLRSCTELACLKLGWNPTCSLGLVRSSPLYYQPAINDPFKAPQTTNELLLEILAAIRDLKSSCQISSSNAAQGSGELYKMCGWRFLFTTPHKQLVRWILLTWRIQLVMDLDQSWWTV